MPKLIIIDEYFANKVGHYYEYNKSVKEIFDAAGYECKIYAGSRLPPAIQKEVNAVATFSSLPKNGLNKIPVLGQLINRVRFWKNLHKEIMRVYHAEKDPGTVFFFTTVVWYNLLPVAYAAMRSRQRSVLLYRLSIYEHAGLPNQLQAVGDWLYRSTFKKLIQHPQVRFCTDSDVIANECNEEYSCNMKVLPIPHIKDDYVHAASGQADVSGKFILYAPGAIREEKGIGFIVSAFEYIAQKKPDLLKKCILVTQYNDGADKAHNDSVKQRLSSLPLENTFLGNLSTEEYHQRLYGADIILIPYSTGHGYRARTSGIMSETIAACKPFITSRNSWMEIQSKNYNTGVSVQYNDCNELMMALEQITGNYPHYHATACAAKDQWLQFHSKDNFKAIFEQLIQ